MPQIPENIPHGDMPGDKIEIGNSHIQKAAIIFPEVLKALRTMVPKNPYERVVISVCGGSGVGKSEIASILGYLLRQIGIGAYVLSGDNYPHRIPKYNDAERLRIFREGGIRSMAGEGTLTGEHFAMVRKWQEEERDADASLCEQFPWFAGYLSGARDALAGYLGSNAETDFAEVDQILKAFLDGAKDLWLRRMGREESALWYDKVDMSRVQVLLLEWTHGNSDHLQRVNLPILLNSTPQETLAHRRARGRDGKLDSPFTTTVLNIEQEMLHRQAKKAQIIVAKSGELLDYAAYERLMQEEQ
ncbi:MAG: adenylylsulfate kinase [Lachnospiraceae bacterium]|nr:adenylylsulfate kinase [Lachnospiraceae bacterium]